MVNENQIHPTARIADNVILGSYNVIGERVTIGSFHGKAGPIIIGDCNIIHNDVRILGGEQGVSIGDWNVVHNHCLLGGSGRLDIGHNGWFGEMTLLDSTGGLTLDHGVRIGTMGHVWSHAASAEQLEGGYYKLSATHLCDDVWLVGNNVTVNPGVTLRRKSVILPMSVVTHDTDVEAVYAGIPARKMAVRFWQPLSDDEKFRLMLGWVYEFVKTNSLDVTELEDSIIFSQRDDWVIVGFDLPESDKHGVSWFDLRTKRYSKRLTSIEREFYRFLYGNKARFLPEGSKK